MALYAKSDELIKILETNEEEGDVDMCKALKDWAEEERALGHAEGREFERTDIFKLISSMFNAGESAESVKRIAEDETFFKAMHEKYLCV